MLVLARTWAPALVWRVKPGWAHTTPAQARTPPCPQVPVQVPVNVSRWTWAPHLHLQWRACACRVSTPP